MDSQPTNRANATFTILSSTLSVDEMVRAVSLTPDRSVEKGSPVKGTGGGIHRYSAVSFRSRTDCHADPGAHIDDLLLRLSPAGDAIRRLVEQRLADEPQSVPARLSLYVKSSRSVVGLDVTSAQLTAIGELGAYFGVEVDTDSEDE
jgi:hypothetical protein